MWFEELFGFRESSYEETRLRFVVEGRRLLSLTNERSFWIGEFATPKLAELRSEGRALVRPGAIRVTHEVIGDVLELHALPENQGALFQVASQFNCLEFPGTSTTPEDGVSGYANDPTQGPACSLAAAAATVYRNYFVPLRGSEGQTRDNQIDNLEDLAAAVGRPDEFWSVRNGYTFSTSERLRALGDELKKHDREQLLGEVRIGLQHDVGVTFVDRFGQPEPGFEPMVSQAFCSAVSCAYTPLGNSEWDSLARLVLEASYEATLWAAAINATRTEGSNRVWLTLLGGGAFGNDPEWIAAAIGLALRKLAKVDLDVHIAHYRRADPELESMIDRAALRGEGRP
jgi:hypothetical protein